MFKLNNKGWGLSSMVAYTSIILIALLVATFYVIALYSDLDKTLYGNGNNTNYYDYEEKLGNSAIKYLKNRTSTDGTFVITYDMLRNSNNIDKILDSKTNNECDGYVKVEIKDGNYEAESYIKCDNYITKGY